MEIIETFDLSQGEKELRAVRVRTAVGHGEDAGSVVVQPGGKLIGKGVTRPALAGALRIAALDHKVGHDPVEGEPVVERLARRGSEGALGQASETRDGERQLPVEQFGDDDTAGRGEFGVKPVWQNRIGVGWGSRRLGATGADDNRQHEGGKTGAKEHASILPEDHRGAIPASVPRRGRLTPGTNRDIRRGHSPRW